MRPIWAVSASIVIVAAVLLGFTDAGRFFVFALLSNLFDPGPPAIIGDIRCTDWRSCDKQNAELNAVLHRTFPDGTTVNRLERTLTAQGFHHDKHVIAKCTTPGEPPSMTWSIYCPAWDNHWDPRNRLIYQWGAVPCGSEVGVRWSADGAGRIAHLDGYYSYSCM